MVEYTMDDFLGGRIRLKQEKSGLRATSDSVLLASSVVAKTHESVLDVGTGNGVVALCIGSRIKDLALTGFELQPELVALARENASFNRIPLEVIQGDVLKRCPELHSRQFHHVVTNPPFYTEDHVRQNPQQKTAYNQMVSLSDWLSFCLRHVRAKGTLTLIHRTEALSEILSVLSPKLGGLEIIPIQPRSDRSGKRVIIRGIMGSKKPLSVLPALVLHEMTGERTTRAEDIMRRGAPLF